MLTLPPLLIAAISQQRKTLADVEFSFLSLLFNDPKRDYIHAPKLGDKIREALIAILGDEFDFGKLYHHSELSKYSVQYADNTSQCLLGTPNIGAIKNPVALRTLQIIRKKVNALITNNIIDPDDTRVVIETTRNFNDANMRWAIKEYQKARENEHKEIIALLQEIFPNRNLSDKDLDKTRFFFEQQDDYDKIYGKSRYAKDIKKYKLWKEQGCICIYTGKPTRMLMFSGYDYVIFDEEGNRIDNPHWFEIARQRWAKKYKDSSTPCSCWLCRGEKYNRKAYKQTTRRIIDESME